MLRDLLDKCLKQANHLLIFENAELFQWVFEQTGERQGLALVEALVKNIAKGTGKQVIEQRFVQDELLRCARNGSGGIAKVKRLLELGGEMQEIAQVKDRHGLVVGLFPEKEEMIRVCGGETGTGIEEWNPVHVGIFFNQVKFVSYLCEEVKINIRMSIRMPGTHTN